MDPSHEIATEILPIIRTYKDGRVERLAGTDVVPASLDPSSAGVLSKDVLIDPTTGVSARLYAPLPLHSNTIPLLVYYHGGGFCIESAASPIYHAHLTALSARAGVLVVSVNYRLAPEHPIPAAYDDSWGALQWALSASDEWISEHADVSRVFIGGDSTGGNIAHHVAMRAGAAGVGLVGALLVHPFFWGEERIGSESEEGVFTFPSVAMIEALWPFVCGASAAADGEDLRLNPVAAEAPSLAGLACRRVLVAVAGGDLLRDRGWAYHDGLRRSGWRGEVEVVESEGDSHVFHLFDPESDKALELMDRLVGFLTSTLKSQL